MPIIFQKHQIGYWPAPKVACSSLKHAFFQLENGFEFKPFFALGVHHSIHTLYGTRDFKKGRGAACRHKITIVRDPLKRFISDYANRVIKYRELNEHVVEAADLDVPSNPTLSQFIEHLEDYRKISTSIRHHFAPMCQFIGTDPTFFTRIYSIGEIPQIAKDLTSIFGKTFEIGHYQTGGPSIGLETLTDIEIARLKEIYRQDYDVWGSFL